MTTLNETLTTPAASITEAIQRPHGLTFDKLRETNVARCIAAYHPAGINEWSPTDWATAMAGECGEACNDVKKLRRIAVTPEVAALTTLGRAQRDDAVSKIADELADVVIYADLLAARLGIDLGKAIRKKFNDVSDRKGVDIKL